MGGTQEQRPRSRAALAVTTVVTCAALVWVGLTAGTEREAQQVRLGVEAAGGQEYASLDEVEAARDVDCPDLATTPVREGYVVCASVGVRGGETRPVPSEPDPLTEVLVAQGYCAVAPLTDGDEVVGAEPTEGCLPSSVPLDLSGVSDEDRTMIENLLSVPDPEFTIAE